MIREGQERGPFDDSTLKQLASSGKLRPQDQIRRSDSTATHLAKDIKGLFANPTESPPPVRAATEPPPAMPAPTKKTPSIAENWKSMPLVKKILVAGGLMVPLFGAMRGCAQSGSGAITFAERVDPRTMETFREGKKFSPGIVQLIIRARKPFGDTRVIVYGRVHDESQWTVVKEETVDASWTMLATPIMLGDPGKYDVKATNSRGKVIAQSVVEITGR